MKDEVNPFMTDLDDKFNLPKEMQLIPFRIIASDDEENYSLVYSFLVKGTSKDPYETEIDIDDFNDLGITDSRCTCLDYVFRQKECKHIVKCKEILKEHGVSW